MPLRKAIIRLAHSKPELRPQLLPLLANEKVAFDKTAMDLGKEIFQELVDMRKLYGARKALTFAGDKQTSDLLRDIMSEMMTQLEPKNRGMQRALNRLRNALHGNQDPANLRNQIFKVANELGMKLPSSSF